MTAETRLRKGVYTPRGVWTVHRYTGAHSKTVVFGLITFDGRDFFVRYDMFRKEEFMDFLRQTHEKFGKIKKSGLWRVQHLESEGLTDPDMKKISECIRETERWWRDGYTKPE